MNISKRKLCFHNARYMTYTPTLTSHLNHLRMPRPSGQTVAAAATDPEWHQHLPFMRMWQPLKSEHLLQFEKGMWSTGIHISPSNKQVKRSIKKKKKSKVGALVHNVWISTVDREGKSQIVAGCLSSWFRRRAFRDSKMVLTDLLDHERVLETSES